LKTRWCFLIFIFLILNTQVFAKGKTDEAEIKKQNDEWFLCITSFDTSSLPADKTNISGVVSRELTYRLSSINYRTRISPEYAYYEEYAWARERSAAAKKISAKMDERSRQIYMGEPNWKYRQNIKKIDSDLKVLMEALEEIDKNAPLINNEPVFKLTSGNLELVFPASPEAGSENRFCTTQKADAFLSGQITDFYGRYYLTLKLYTVYTRSYVWEDNVIFSYNDIDGAIDEITRKLKIVLSGNSPAAVTIRAEPETALVLINQSFAGRGEAALIEYPPGTITVTASAPDYESIDLETELFSGEHSEINIKLKAIDYVDTEITGNEQSNVYHGALYIGESPLTLRLPANSFEYIEIEAANGNRGSTVFRTQDTNGLAQSLSLKMSQPINKGQVDKERRGYYWAWGSQWLTGIAAWIGYYSFLGSNNAAAYGYNNGISTQELINSNVNLFYFTIGAAAAFGVTSIYGIYRMIRYIYISGKDSTPIAPASRNK
jgi:hypothetical protein